MSSNSHPRRVVIVGAGITGLAAAQALLTSEEPGAPLEVTVVEGSNRPGGKLYTIDLDGLPVEAGADSFVVRKPWAVELCAKLGLADEVVIPGSWGAFVWTGGELVAYPDRAPFGIPSDLGDLLRWQGLPRGPKLRALGDLVKPRRKAAGDEPLGSLLRRRLGSGASRILVEPLLAGLHAGDPMRLSVLATFPELKDWETRHGSLIRGAKAAVAAAGEEAGHKPLFASLWGGLSGLVDRLVEVIGEERLRLRHRVRALRMNDHRLSVLIDGAGGGPFPADAVVLATPADEAARILAAITEEASRALAEVPYASTAMILLAYPPGTASLLPQGTGLVVPHGEATITACTWVSRKWPRKEFGERALVRCFVGRAGSEEALALPDDQLTAIVSKEVEAATPLGVPPDAVRVVRWDRSMPQYEVGHGQRVGRIEEILSAVPGVFLAGSAYRGVGIPDCIRQGGEAAHRVLEYLQRLNGEGGRHGGADVRVLPGVHRDTGPAGPVPG
jgi:protoporphyrinogen/coproporphyrinogen III oxidase